MPVIVRCEGCQKSIKVPDDAIGKRVKCPGCATVFVASESGPSSPVSKSTPAKPPKPPSSSRPPKPPSSSIKATPPPLPPASRSKAPAYDDLEEIDEDDEEVVLEDDADEDDVEFEDEEDDRKSRKKKKKEDEDGGKLKGSSKAGWRSVREGIHNIIQSISISILLGIIGGILVGIIGSVFAPNVAINPGGIDAGANLAAAKSSMMPRLILQSLLGLVVSITYGALNTWGHKLITAIPDRKGIQSGTMANVTFILVACSFGLTLLGNLISLLILFMGGIMSSLNLIVTICLGLGGLCYLASVFTFWIVLKNICRAWGNTSLASQVNYFMITSISLTGLSFVVSIMALFIIGLAAISSIGGGVRPGAAPQINQGAAAVAGIGAIGFLCFFLLMILASLGMLIWYLRILMNVRSMLDKKI